MTVLPTRRSRSMTAAALGVLLCALPAAAAPQRPRETSPEAAVAVQGGRGTTAETPPPVFERPRTPASLGFHGFSVVLVVGGSQGGGANDTVPEAARKALADMKDFLPYKRYQLLDAAWMLCCGPSRGAISGQVRGPEGRDYQYSIDTLAVADNKLNLRFTMRETAEPAPAIGGQGRLSDTARLEHSRQVYDAVRERDEAEIAQRAAQKRFDVGVVATPEMEAANTRLRRAQQRVQDLQQLVGSTQTVASGQPGARGQGGARGQSTVRPSGPRTLMDSTFSIALGETVVIGTSRIMGDQALIAVLTAAAKPGASR